MPKKKTRSIRLEDSAWSEIDRLAQLLGLDRSKVLREVSLNRFPKIKTRRQAASFIYPDDDTASAQKKVAVAS